MQWIKSSDFRLEIHLESNLKCTQSAQQAVPMRSAELDVQVHRPEEARDRRPLNKQPYPCHSPLTVPEFVVSTPKDSP